MDENEDIRMVKKRLLVDTIRDEGRVCGKILAVAFVDVGKRKEKATPRFQWFH